MRRSHHTIILTSAVALLVAVITAVQVWEQVPTSQGPRVVASRDYSQQLFQPVTFAKQNARNQAFPVPSQIEAAIEATPRRGGSPSFGAANQRQRLTNHPRSEE